MHWNTHEEWQAQKTKEKKSYVDFSLDFLKYCNYCNNATSNKKIIAIDLM